MVDIGWGLVVGGLIGTLMVVTAGWFLDSVRSGTRGKIIKKFVDDAKVDEFLTALADQIEKFSNQVIQLQQTTVRGLEGLAEARREVDQRTTELRGRIRKELDSFYWWVKAFRKEGFKIKFPSPGQKMSYRLYLSSRRAKTSQPPAA